MNSNELNNRVKMLHEMLNVLDKHTETGDKEKIDNYLHKELFRVIDTIKDRLEYLRGELRGECISYGELIELQSLVPYIGSDDVELLEAAGVEENTI